MATSEQYLTYLAVNGFDKMLDSGKFEDEKIQEYFDRLERELDMIIDLGFSDYFLIVRDIVMFAKDNGIMCGPARGSVAGSLIAYVIGITEVDPIRFDLIFERFMNPERSKTDPPDVDMDFQKSRREEVRRYVADKYGSERVAPIGAIDVMYASSALRDVWRALGMETNQINPYIANRMSNTTLIEAADKFDDLREFVESDPKHVHAYDLASSLQGLARHRTVHPAGLLIAPDGKLSDYVPLVKSKDQVVSQWKDTYVAKVGMLKIDILGLTTMDIINDAIKFIERDEGDNITLSKIKLDNKEVFAMFAMGKTSTVFQFDTYLLRNLSKKLSPSSFEDLVSLTTIARPASMDAGVTDRFINRKTGKEKIEYEHPLMEEVTSNTYGLPIYQEQFMKMANLIGGIPLEDTEIMRSAIKKFDSEVMSSFKDRFVRGARGKGSTMKQATGMWDQIQSASGYSFNRAHAVSYSLISYWCMFFKINYPVQWFASNLTHQSEPEKAKQIVLEARGIGIEFETVDINRSDVGFSVKDGKILAGLRSIKGIGDKAAEEIIANRPYEEDSIECLSEKCEKRKVNKKVTDALEGAGAFGEIDIKQSVAAYGFPIRSEMVSIKKLPRCKRCELSECRSRVVYGSGNPRADIMFIGEAPGREEDRSGVPFIGRAGQLLDKKYIRPLGIKRSDAYITNVVKCRPVTDDGGNGKPTDEQVAICSVWLEAEFRIVKPKVVVLLGSYALKALTNEKSVLRCHGKVVPIQTPSGELITSTGFSMVHPAYILRNSDFDLEEAVSNLKVLIGD